MNRLTICLLICFFCIDAAAQDKWDLKKAVDYALDNNISVKQADLQSRFSALELNRNNLSKYPDLNFQGNGGYQFGRSENPTTGVLEDNNFFTSGFQLQTGVTLFNWFSKKYTIESSRLDYEASKAQITKAQNDIALNVAVSYLQVLLAKQQVNISSIQVQQTTSQLDLTRKKVNAGVLPELNAAELEAQLARDSSAYVTAESQVQQLLLQLKAILNLDAALPFDIVAPPLEMIPVESLFDLQPDRVYQLALVNLPQQKVNELKLQAAQQAVKAARASRFPTLSAYGGLGSNYVNIEQPQSFIVVPNKPTGAIVNVNGTNYQVLAPGVTVTQFGVTPYGTQIRNNFRQNVGVSLNVPLFNSGNLRTTWERSKLTVRQSELDIESSNQTLKQDIYKAYNDAVAAIQKFNASKKTVETAQKAFDFSQKRYDLNLVSTFDLLNTQNNLLRAKIEVLYAQFDYVFKLKLLEFYKGQGLKL